MDEYFGEINLSHAAACPKIAARPSSSTDVPRRLSMDPTTQPKFDACDETTGGIQSKNSSCAMPFIAPTLMFLPKQCKASHRDKPLNILVLFSGRVGKDDGLDTAIT